LGRGKATSSLITKDIVVSVLRNEARERGLLVPNQRRGIARCPSEKPGFKAREHYGKGKFAAEAGMFRYFNGIRFGSPVAIAINDGEQAIYNQ
jgi:hypothetical protein